jgi:hypothetical protein
MKITVAVPATSSLVAQVLMNAGTVFVALA